MDIIKLRAYAKVNLGLDVIRTLDNGYHEVKMIMQNIDLFDKVTISKKKTEGITVTTNLKFLPVNRDNLVYRAAELLMDEFNIKEGVDIDLYKFIPVAAGMAGGSSDAAAVLKGVNTLFELGLSEQDLMDRGARLGADIPYCIMGGTALAEGIGEKLTRLNKCPDCYIVVGKPSISVSTKFVYDNLILDENTEHPDIDGIIQSINNDDIKGVADKLENVLETVTINEYPIIEEIKNDMKECGALNAIMSGSGPTVFGIFDDLHKAEACNEKLRQDGKAKYSYLASLINGGE